MASRILGTLLRPLERLYKFPDAQKGSPDSVELDLPIQVVHDVHRMASVRGAVAPINDGFWIFTARHAHAGAGTLISTPSVFDTTLPVANGFPADRGGGKTEQAWWIYQCWPAADDSNRISQVFMLAGHGSATVGPYNTGASLQNEPLFFCNDLDLVVGTIAYGVQDADTFFHPRYPVRVLTNPDSTVSALWRIKSIATLAVNCDFAMRFWLGPRGVMPPGM